MWIHIAVSLVTKVSTRPAHTWGFFQLDSGSVCSPSIPSLPSNGRTADTAREKAQCLNSMFASKSCVQNPSLSVPTLPSRTQLSLDFVSFSLDKVESLLSNLDSDSATGPDGISPRVLKTSSAALAHPTISLFYSPSHLLKVICHLLANQQTLPLCMKKVMESISKVMESIIKSFLFSNGLISEHQFGFRTCRSILDMLLLLA